MESWENKTLGDKLNSLHELPAGYSPNLSAKWEIVEAGLPVDEKRRILPLFLRWSVAAAVLLTIGLLWMNTGEKKTDGLVIKQAIGEHLPVSNQPSQFPKVSVDSERSHTSQSSHEMVAIRIDENVKQNNQLPFLQSSKTAAIPVREGTNRSGGRYIGAFTNPGNTNNTDNTISFSLPTDSIAPATIRQTAVTIAPEEKYRPAKKKIYQRDFNDGILVMDTGFAPATRQHFSVQLKPFSRKATDDGEASARRLQLKQVF